MSTRSISSSHLLIAVFLLGLAASACSGGTANPGSGPGTQPAQSAAPTSNAVGAVPTGACNPEASAVGAVSGPYASAIGAALCGMSDLNPCSLLNSTDVQALFSVPLATPSTDHLGRCTWALTDPTKGDGLDVVVHVGGSGASALNDDIDLAHATPISDIGDQAAWELLAGYFPHLGAIQGQDTCELTIGGGNGQLSVHTTGKDVFAKIDDSALPGFMQQFGSLCKEIFTGLGASAGGPAPTLAPAATNGSGTGTDICTLLPAAQVAQITGEPIDGSTPRTSTLIPNDVGCTYAEGALASAVLIDVVTPGGAADYDSQVAVHGSNAAPIPGFGDKAFRDDTDGTGFVALFGDTEFTVFILDEDSKVQDINGASEAMITALREKM